MKRPMIEGVEELTVDQHLVVVETVSNLAMMEKANDSYALLQALIRQANLIHDGIGDGTSADQLSLRFACAGMKRIARRWVAAYQNGGWIGPDGKLLSEPGEASEALDAYAEKILRGIAPMATMSDGDLMFRDTDSSFVRDWLSDVKTSENKMGIARTNGEWIDQLDMHQPYKNALDPMDPDISYSTPMDVLRGKQKEERKVKPGGAINPMDVLPENLFNPDVAYLPQKRKQKEKRKVKPGGAQAQLAAPRTWLKMWRDLFMLRYTHIQLVGTGQEGEDWKIRCNNEIGFRTVVSNMDLEPQRDDWFLLMHRGWDVYVSAHELIMYKDGGIDFDTLLMEREAEA